MCSSADLGCPITGPNSGGRNSVRESDAREKDAQTVTPRPRHAATPLLEHKCAGVHETGANSIDAGKRHSQRMEETR